MGTPASPPPVPDGTGSKPGLGAGVMLVAALVQVAAVGAVFLAVNGWRKAARALEERSAYLADLERSHSEMLRERETLAKWAQVAEKALQAKRQEVAGIRDLVVGMRDKTDALKKERDQALVEKERAEKTGAEAGAAEKAKAAKALAEARETELRLAVRVAGLEKERRELAQQLATGAQAVGRLQEQVRVLTRLVKAQEEVPNLRGRVEQVAPDVFQCMISLGKRDGVFEGMKFTVARGDQYIGMVEVRKIFPAMSSAQFLVEMTAPGKKIEVGDSVRTAQETSRVPGHSHVRVPEPWKDLTGEVTRTAETEKLVTINLGRDHGVELQQVFRVSRGAQFICLVKVQDVRKEQCSARVEGSGAPKVGDRVKTAEVK